MGGKITRHQELEVYKKAFEAAMEIFQLSKEFPKEETYSLTDQIRRSSRSVCSNIAEGWRKRRYEAAFVSKLMRRVRRPKPKHGSNFRFVAITLKEKLDLNYSRNMMK